MTKCSFFGVFFIFPPLIFACLQNSCSHLLQFQSWSSQRVSSLILWHLKRNSCVLCQKATKRGCGGVGAFVCTFVCLAFNLITFHLWNQLKWRVNRVATPHSPPDMETPTNSSSCSSNRGVGAIKTQSELICRIIWKNVLFKMCFIIMFCLISLKEKYNHAKKYSYSPP